jgi:eukaryotic-like serine/threonine-protein kinase
MQPKSTDPPASASGKAETWVGDRRDREEPAEDSPPPPSASGAHEIAPGRIVDGRYQIEALLGAGAVGLVYRCRHLVLDKTLAIKVLRPDFARDPEVSARLVNEAKAASAIGSAHIVETVDFGTLPDGSAFFVMEYLEGTPLTSLVEDPDSALSAEDVLHIALQLSDALTEAHAAGIVHRDLKPDNVFIITRGDDRRFVKVLDFGIAKLARAERKLTRAGQIYGTPHYMSPEQAAGRGTDARTDIYAVGVLLYEMVTGRVPFDAEEPMGILVQHLSTAPPEITEVRTETSPVIPGIDAVIRKCLAKLPEDRYASMAELRADLLRLEKGLAPLGTPRLGRPPPKPVQHPPAISIAAPAPRPGRMVHVVAGVAIAVSMTLGYALYTKRGGSVAPPAPEPALPTPAPAASAVPLEKEEPAEKAEDPRGRPVMVVVIPPDALIYHGKKNLGTMPVTVHVPRDEKIQLEIRAQKFVTRLLTLDGQKPKVVVGLVPKSKFRKAKGVDDEAEADKAAEAAMVGTDEPSPAATAPVTDPASREPKGTLAPASAPAPASAAPAATIPVEPAATTPTTPSAASPARDAPAASPHDPAPREAPE